MFGGFYSLLFFCCRILVPPCRGVTNFVFARYFFLVLGQIFLIRIHLALLGCFCLESLILAQDERWRRA